MNTDDNTRDEVIDAKLATIIAKLNEVIVKFNSHTHCYDGPVTRHDAYDETTTTNNHIEEIS